MRKLATGKTVSVVTVPARRVRSLLLWSVFGLLLMPVMMPGAPARAQDVGIAGTGAVKLGGAAVACDATMEGAIRYSSASDVVELCNDTPAWVSVGPLGGGSAAGSDREIQFNSAGSMSAASTFVYTSAGNVGIGTTSPAQKLDVVGNFQVRDSGNSKSYRFRTSGGALDFEASGADMYLSTWDGSNFTGTQMQYLVLDSSSQTATAKGNWNFQSLINNPIFTIQGIGSTNNIGIGVASPTYGLHIAPTMGVTALQTVFIQDATPTTGKTKIVIQGGPGQNNDGIMDILDPAGNPIMTFGNKIGNAAFRAEQFVQAPSFNDIGGGFALQNDNGGMLRFTQNGDIAFTNGASAFDTLDTGISRNAAGILEINSSTAGAFRDLILRNIEYTGYNEYRGMGAPSLSAAGEGRIYFDSGSNKFRVSENGGAYADLLGGGAAAGSDRQIQFNSAGSMAAASGFVYTSAGRMGIGTANPSLNLSITNATTPGIRLTDTTTGYTGTLQMGSYGTTLVDAGQFLRLASTSGVLNLACGASGCDYGSISITPSDVSLSTAYSTSTNLILASYNSALINLMPGGGGVILGSGHNTATPVGTTLAAPSASGTNIAGADLVIHAGAGTGNNASGSLIFRTGTGGMSGTDPNDMYTRMIITNSGRVGIGAFTPATALDVTGTIRVGNGAETCAAGVAGGIRYNGGNLEYCNGSAWTVLSSGSGAAASPDRGIQFNSGGSFAADANFVYNASGNVGLGIASPLWRLHLNAGNNGIRLQNSTFNDLLITQDSSGSTFVANGGHMMFQTNAGAGNLASGTTRLFIHNSGNIGLGGITSGTTPSYLLSLEGNAARSIGMERHTTADTAGNSLTLIAGGATTGATNKDGGGLILSGGIATGTGDSNVQIQAYQNGSAMPVATFLGDSLGTLFGGNVRIPASGYYNFGATFGSSGYGIRDNAGTIECKNSGGSWAACAGGSASAASPDRGIQFNSGGSLAADANFVFTSAGNLGIGTAAPGTTKLMVTNLGAGNSFRVNDETGDNDATPFIINAAGNVGIGTASPGFQTHIYAASGFNTLRIENDGTSGSDGPSLNLDRGGTSSYATVDFTTTGNGAMSIGLKPGDSTNGFTINDIDASDATRFFIDGGTGKIGIAGGVGNPVSPTYDVSINGTIARTIGMERHTTASSAGNNMTILAGGATSGATNKDGGSLILSSGIATGDGGSEIVFQNVRPYQGGGTTARNPSTIATITGLGGFELGTNLDASNEGSIAIGNQVYSQNPYSIAMGNYVAVITAAPGGIALGQDAVSEGDYSVAFGVGSSGDGGGPNTPKVSGDSSFAVFMGDQSSVDVSANNAFAILGGKVIIDPDTTSAANVTPSVELDVIGDIEYTGTITDVSDIRLKKDITPLDKTDIIERLGLINTYSFRMKDDEKGQLELGVIAQEVEKVFPELVRTDETQPEKYKSVNYVGFIAPLIEASKDLKAENDVLKADLAAVRADMDLLAMDVKGLKAHTGYGINRAQMGLMALAVFGAAVLAFMAGAALMRRQSRRP